MGLSLRESIARSIPRVREDAVIESRADLLPAADRDLVLAVWTYHQPTRMVADMRGTSAHAVRRRLHLLIDRLHSDEFIGAARVMRLLNPGQAEVARMHFCYGLSIRATARATGAGYHETRRLAAEVIGLIVGLRNLRDESERLRTQCGWAPPLPTCVGTAGTLWLGGSSANGEGRREVSKSRRTPFSSRAGRDPAPGQGGPIVHSDMTTPKWDITVNVKIDPPPRRPAAAMGPEALALWAGVEAMFGLKAKTETIYENFRVTVAPGEIVAVVGPSGAGKSILLRAIREGLEGPRRPDARRERGALQSRSTALEVDDLAESDLPAIACLDEAKPPDLPAARPGLRLSPAPPVGRSAERRSPRSSPASPDAANGLSRRLEVLSRCGLAEASALLRPARCLSGGQQYRLALARAVWQAVRASNEANGKGRLLLVDEFAAALDSATAEALAFQMSKLVRRYNLAVILATPRQELLGALHPARVIVKPLGGPPVVLQGGGTRKDRLWGSVPKFRRWPIEPGRIADYHALGRFHYLAGPPAAHKRVWVVRAPEKRREPGAPDVAAVLVVSPPVLNCRGRNVATGGRYAGPNRAECLNRLNAEVECISRVVVHPIYRGCGLAVRLARHALRTAETPLVEALARMGAVHPFLELAGMTAYRLPRERYAERFGSAADAVGLTAADVAAVEPVRRFLASSKPAARRFLKDELDRFARHSLPARLRNSPQALAEACRRAGWEPIYYLAEKLRRRREDLGEPCLSGAQVGRAAPNLPAGAAAK